MSKINNSERRPFFKPLKGSDYDIISHDFSSPIHTFRDTAVEIPRDRMAILQHASIHI